MQTPVDLKMVQEAWRNPEKAMAPGQAQPGYRYFRVRARPHVRLSMGRMGNVTTIVIDPKDTIDENGIVNGDSSSLLTLQKSANTVLMMPTKMGVDTSLDIHADGRIYQFQVIAEAMDVEWVTDRRVDVRQTDRGTREGNARTRRGTVPNHDRNGFRSIGREAPGGRRRRPVRHAPVRKRRGRWSFDPGSVESARTIGLQSKDAAIIAPVRVWRDKEWDIPRLRQTRPRE